MDKKLLGMINGFVAGMNARHNAILDKQIFEIDTARLRAKAMWQHEIIMNMYYRDDEETSKTVSRVVEYDKLVRSASNTPGYEEQLKRLMHQRALFARAILSYEAHDDDRRVRAILSDVAHDDDGKVNMRYKEINNMIRQLLSI